MKECNSLLRIRSNPFVAVKLFLSAELDVNSCVKHKSIWKMISRIKYILKVPIFLMFWACAANKPSDHSFDLNKFATEKYLYIDAENNLQKGLTLGQEEIEIIFAFQERNKTTLLTCMKGYGITKTEEKLPLIILTGKWKGDSFHKTGEFFVDENLVFDFCKIFHSGESIVFCLYGYFAKEFQF